MFTARAALPVAVRRGVAVACGSVALGLGLAGCAQPPAVPVMRELPRRGPEVRIVNASPHAWRVTFRGEGAATPQVVRVEPRATVEVTLAAPGAYVIEQAIESALADRPMPRVVTTRFEAGESYDWVLATLLTADGGGAAKP